MDIVLFVLLLRYFIMNVGLSIRIHNDIAFTIQYCL